MGGLRPVGGRGGFARHSDAGHPLSPRTLPRRRGGCDLGRAYGTGPGRWSSAAAGAGVSRGGEKRCRPRAGGVLLGRRGKVLAGTGGGTATQGGGRQRYGRK